MAARAGHTDLPHDLAQFIVEAALGLEEGFLEPGGEWGQLQERRAPPDQARAAAHRGPALDAMLARWRALRVGEELVVEWPTRRLPRASLRVRRAATQRRPRESAGPDLD